MKLEPEFFYQFCKANNIFLLLLFSSKKQLICSLTRVLYKLIILLSLLEIKIVFRFQLYDHNNFINFNHLCICLFYKSNSNFL